MDCSAADRQLRAWWGEFRTDPDLLAQLAIKEGLSSHCIMQAKVSAATGERWLLGRRRFSQYLAPPPSFPFSILPSLRMDEFNTEVVRNKGRFPQWSSFFIFWMTHGIKIKPSPHPLVTQPYLLPFLTLWLLLFLGFPSLLSVLYYALSLCSITEAPQWLL